VLLVSDRQNTSQNHFEEITTQDVTVLSERKQQNQEETQKQAALRFVILPKTWV
jgi:hypothetical protein